jgi:hypothetical protein
LGPFVRSLHDEEFVCVSTKRRATIQAATTKKTLAHKTTNKKKKKKKTITLHHTHTNTNHDKTNNTANLSSCFLAGQRAHGTKKKKRGGLVHAGVGPRKTCVRNKATQRNEEKKKEEPLIISFRSRKKKKIDSIREKKREITRIVNIIL